ncbi:hypothetical protein ACQZV8_10065 [Magnetococcales bacterium HHB-1]
MARLLTSLTQSPKGSVWLFIGLSGSISVFPWIGLQAENQGYSHFGEHLVIMLHGFSALVTFALWRQRKTARVIQVMQHPFVLFPLAIALWSVITSPFHPFPDQTWFGSFYLGEGVVWYLDWSMLTAGMLYARQWYWGRNTLPAVALLFLACLALLVIGGKIFSQLAWASYLFADSLFYLFFLGLLIFYLFFRSRFRTIRWRPLLIPIIAVIIVVSYYRLESVLVFLLLILLWLLLLPLRRWPKVGHVVVILWPLCFAGGLYHGIETEQRWWPKDTTMRQQLWKNDIALLSERITQHFVGEGWGTFPERAAMQINWDWRKRDEAQWQQLNRIELHSQNVFLEAWGAGGWIGLFLVLGLWFAPLFWSLQRFRILLWLSCSGLVISGILWPLLPLWIPFFALAWAGAADLHKPFLPLNEKIRRFKGALFLTTVLIQCCTIFLLWRFSWQTTLFHPMMLEKQTTQAIQGENCPTMLWNIQRSDRFLQQRFSSLSRTIILLANQQPEIAWSPGQKIFFAQQMNRLRGITCLVEQRLKQSPNRQLLLTTMLFHHALASVRKNQQLDPFVKVYMTTWEPHLKIYHQMSGAKQALWAPYLRWLVDTGEHSQLATISHWLYQQNPLHPVALWYSGIALLENQRTSPQGLERMKQAQARGIEKIVSLNHRFYRQLKATRELPKKEGNNSLILDHSILPKQKNVTP